MAAKILILFAHPAPRRSESNVALARAANALPYVTLVDLYGRYPTFDIDVDHEQAQLLAHDIIIFQHPLYWYSTPAILKEWQDLVLEYGFAYGSGGTALQDKVLFSALTGGGPASAYSGEGDSRFTIRQLLAPLEQTARLCGMRYLPPFALFGARTAAQDGRHTKHRSDWLRMLRAMGEARFDFAAAADVPLLNTELDTLVQGS